MLAVSFALLAGFLFAFGASLQQQVGRAALPVDAAARVPVRRLHVWLPITASFRSLLRHPVWLAGWLVNGVGFVTQAIALHEGTVALVQPILVTQLLFTVPISVWHTRRRPSAATLAFGCTVFLGVALFIANWARGTEGTPDRARVLGAVLAAIVLAVALVTVPAARVGRSVRAVFASIAAGLCFAVSAALMKLTLDSVLRNGVAAAAEWPGYLLLVSTALGLIIGQDALAAGHLSAAVAGMAITNPVASTAIGIFGFRERVPITAGVLVGLIGAGLLIIGGVIGLARSAARSAKLGAEADPAATHPTSIGNWVAGLTH